MRFSIEALIRQRMLGAARLGATRAEVMAALGRPDLSLNMPPEQSPIWCFGSFQLHFDGDRVEGFFAEFVSALDPGPGRTLDGWIFDSCTERSGNIVAALQDRDVAISMVRDPNGWPIVRVVDGADLLFDPSDDQWQWFAISTMSANRVLDE